MQINDKLAEGYRAMFENDRETAERHFACIYGDSEMKSLTPRRVELWLVNFNLGRGSEQGAFGPHSYARTIPEIFTPPDDFGRHIQRIPRQIA